MPISVLYEQLGGKNILERSSRRMQAMRIITMMAIGVLVTASTVHADPASSHALNNFNRAMVQVNEIETACYAARAELKPGILGDTKLKPEHIRTALSYFYYRNLAECTESAVSHFVLNAAILTALDSDKTDDVAAGVALITQPHVSALQREVEYLQLPPEVRDYLESIEELMSPFQLSSASGLLPASGDEGNQEEP